MDLNVSGLASGFDWKSMVEQLTSVERAPQRRMRTEQAGVRAKNAAFTSLKTELTSLKTVSEKLKETSFFDTRKVTSSETHTTATADSGTSSGEYNFEVFQLATSAKQLGAADVGAAVTASSAMSSGGFSIAVSAGTVTVQGKQVTVSTDDSLTTTLAAIKTAVGGSFDYSVSGDKVTLTDSSEIVLGSATDTSNFLQSLRLNANGTTSITSSGKLGGIDMSVTPANANFTDGAGAASGSFKINGTTISWDSSATITDILDKINSSEASVYANYDPVNDRFLLTNKTTGDVGITLEDVTGDFLAKTRLLTANSGALSRGKNLLYKVNDAGPLESKSNTIDSNSSGIQGLAVTATKANGASKISSVDTSGETVTTESSHGYSTGEAVTVYSPGTIPGGLSTNTTYYVRVLSSSSYSLHTTKANAESGTNAVDLTSTQTGDVYMMSSSPKIATVSVQSDTETIKNKIAGFISQINRVQSLIKAQTASSTDSDGKVKLGVLAGESLVSMTISGDIRTKAIESVDGMTGTITRLESIGYTSSGYTNELSLSDSSTLETALSENLGQVKSLFTTATDGLANSMYTYLDTLLDDDGSLETTQNNLTNQISSIDKQIADHERRVQMNRDTLIRSFVNMEQAQSKINNDMSFLMSRFK
ncbi:MAG: flagellar filament capping protein FliD [Limisphaerales bacterium]|jgi:flagellar capping protein FliD